MNLPAAGANALYIKIICVHLQQIITLKRYRSFGLFDFSINCVNNHLKDSI